MDSLCRPRYKRFEHHFGHDDNNDHADDDDVLDDNADDSYNDNADDDEDERLCFFLACGMMLRIMCLVL